MALQAKKKILLTDRQKKILFPSLTAVILLAAMFQLIVTCFNSLHKIERELSEASRKEKAILKLQSFQKKEQEVLKAFPTIQEKNDIIKEIAGWARKEGLEVASIEPKEEELPGTNFRQLTFTMNGSGDYLSTMRFLKRVESSAYFIMTSGLQLKGYDLQRGRTRFGDSKNTALQEKGFQVTVNVFLLQ